MPGIPQTMSLDEFRAASQPGLMAGLPQSMSLDDFRFAAQQEPLEEVSKRVDFDAYQADPVQYMISSPAGQAWQKTELTAEQRAGKRIQEEIHIAREKGMPWSDYMMKRVPFLGSLYSAFQTLSLRDAIRRIDQGQPRRSDIQDLANFIAEGERRENWGYSKKILDLLASSATFAAEFATTGGVLPTGRKVGQAAATRMLGKSAEKFAGRAATKLMGEAAATVTHTAFNPTLVANEAARHMVDEFKLGRDEEGLLRVLIEKEGDGFLEALPKGFLSAFIELGSERTGGHLAKLIPGRTKAQALKAAVIRRWLNREPGRRVIDLARKVATKTRWDGVIGEMLEERVGEVARGVTGLEEFPDITSEEYFEQLLVEGLAFSVPGLAKNALSLAYPGVPPTPGEPSTEAAPPGKPTAPTKEGLLTPEGATALAQEQPEVAKQLAAKETPARRDPAMKAVAKPQEKWSKDERTRLATLAREALAVEQEKTDALQQAPQEREQEVRAQEPAEVPEGVRQPEAQEVVSTPPAPRPAPSALDARAGGKKQPWEMTQEEWRSQPREIPKRAGGTFTAEWKPLPKNTYEKQASSRLDYQHVKAIKAAIKEGKPVPVEVLEDYPYLAKGQGRLALKAKQARGELSDALNELGKHQFGTTFANPLDPKLIKLTAQAAAKAVKAGIYSFADFVEQMVQRFGHEQVKSIAAAIERAWAQVQKKDTTGKVSAPGQVQAVIEALPPERLAVRTPERQGLAMPVEAPEAQELVRQTDAARKAAGEPARRAQEDVDDEATQRLQADYEGERERLLQVARRGGQLGDTDTVVAREILEREGVEAIKSGDRQKIADGIALVWAYRMTGTEQGRAFRQRREKTWQRMIAEALFMPPQRQQDKIEEARRHGDQAEANRLLDKWAAEMEELRRKLALLGIDLDHLDDYTNDPVLAARAVGTIQAAKADFWDKAYEYWRNSILSAITTHGANVIGNTGYAAYHLTAQRFAAVLINTARRDPKSAQWGEFTHMLAGLMPGVSRGLGNALMAWKTETPYFEASLGKPGRQKIEEPGVTIQGRTGRAIRMPQRMLLAADEFAKTVIAQVEVGAQAFRIAKAEGYTGQELQARMSALIADSTSPVWGKAVETAVLLTFQSQEGKVLPGVLGLRRKVPGIRYQIPFVTTPLNIFKLGARNTLLGLIPLSYRMAAGKYKGGKSSKMTEHMAEQLLAGAAVWALMAWMDDDDGEPRITGAAPEFLRGSRELARRAYPAQSIRINGTWYSYARIEPFATSLGLTIDWLRAMRTGDPTKMVETPYQSLIGQVKNKTFLSGVGDILRALEIEGGGPKALQWIVNFATSWVPNIVRSSGRATQDVYPNRRMWGQGPEWGTRLMRRAIQKTELGLIRDEPSVDVWGREAPRSRSPVPHTDFVWRAAVPIRTRRENVAVGDRFIMAWNNENPDAEWYPGMPPPRYRHKNENHYMTDQQYTKFLRLSGQIADRLVQMEGLDPEHPTEGQLTRLKKLLSKGRTIARRDLMKEWHGGPPASMDTGTIAKTLWDEQVKQIRAKAYRKYPAKAFKGMTWEETYQMVRQEKEQAAAWLAEHRQAG